MAEATLPAPASPEPIITRKPGSRLSLKDVRAVYRVMSQVPEEERDADRFVEEARPEVSPIHHLVEWDDEVAASEHRRQQAREAMRSVVFQVQTRHSEIHYPVFFATRVDNSPLRSYVRQEYLSAHQENAEEVIEKARGDLAAFTKRYWKHRDLLVEALPELREVFPDES